jgi:inhibitor-of-growth protein 1
LQKVQSALISSLEIGDEKLQLVQTVQDVIENKSRQLETDCKALGSTSFKKKS